MEPEQKNASAAQVCDVCFRHCRIPEGETGYCRARTNTAGVIRPLNYGKITALALDPIEKKPLARFHPGSMILSAGSYGCNLRCPFCQNSEISMADAGTVSAETISPKELCAMADRMQNDGNIGLAFTYNEPLIGYEFVRDTAKLVKQQGMSTVLVTNGTASKEVLWELEPYIDAMNIDLKGFQESYYRDTLGGNLDMVKAFIADAAEKVHVEITTLIVPGENDTEEEITAISKWVASLNGGHGEEIPLHLSRFFPHFLMTDRPATDVSWIYHLASAAREYLHYVYTGNC